LGHVTHKIVEWDVKPYYTIPVCLCLLAKVTAPDICAILPPQAVDRQAENVSQRMLESLLAYMVSEVRLTAAEIFQ